VIVKRGSHVTVGVFTERVKETFGNIFEFDYLVRFIVDAGGRWHMMYVSYRDCFRANWDNIWSGPTIDGCYKILRQAAAPGKDRDGKMNIFSWQLADIIMAGKLWDPVRYEWTIT
jgi:hypothetical protein